MFTVIVLSDAAREIVGRSRVFFEPFEENGSIAFCSWNQAPDALTLTEALPELPAIIRGKKAWRAVVVDHAAAAGDSQRRNAENPFDFLDNERAELNLEDSKHPLVRVAHALLGYPEMSAKSFEPVFSYTDATGSDRISYSASEVARQHPGRDFNQAVAEAAGTQNDVQLQFQEIDYTPAEHAVHRELVKRYHMKELHPAEVVFISTRVPVEVDSTALLRRAWRTEAEHNSSRFVERNDYPASCRFAVYDLLNPENSGYQQDELRLWVSVLTVAVNLLPPSAFQAERVYRLGVEFSDDTLGELLNTHMGRLSAARERLDSLMKTAQIPPVGDLAEVLKPQKVTLQFDKLGGESIVVDTEGYGLAADSPRNERAHWEADFAQLRQQADLFVRKPRRILARAVYEARAKAQSFLGQEHALSDIAREEIDDELRKRIRALTQPATADILNRARLDATLAEHNERVTSYLHERMRRKTIGIASTVVLAVWFAAFVPYLIQAGPKGPAVLGSSLLVVLFVILAVAVAGLGSLVWMRLRLVRLLSSVNAAMRKFVAGVNSGAIDFADFLSNLATFMYARSVVLGASQKNSRMELRRIRAVRKRVVEALNTEKGIVSALGVPLEIRRTPGSLATFDPNSEAEVRRLFRFPIGNRPADFNRSGEKVDAPYAFVSRLTAERVALFEGESSESAPDGDADEGDQR